MRPSWKLAAAMALAGAAGTGVYQMDRSARAGVEAFQRQEAVLTAEIASLRRLFSGSTASKAYNPVKSTTIT